MYTEMQQRYWSKLTQYKFEIIYFQEHFSRYVGINRVIVCVLAVFSSGALGAWALWSKLSFLWSSFIVISQVVSVVNEYLPYKKRIKDISEMVDKLNAVYYNMERQWFDVKSDKIDEKEINSILYKYIDEWEEIQGKYFKRDSLPIKNKITDKANKMKDDYYRMNFEEGDIYAEEQVIN